MSPSDALSDAARFASALFETGELYAEPVSKERAELYWLALKDLPIEQLLQAISVLCRNGRYFPKPSEIRDAIYDLPIHGTPRSES